MCIFFNGNEPDMVETGEINSKCRAKNYAAGVDFHARLRDIGI